MNNSKLVWGECPDKSWTAIGHKRTYCVKKKSYGLWEFEIEYGNACPVSRTSVDCTFLYQCAQFDHDSITSLLAERDEKWISIDDELPPLYTKVLTCNGWVGWIESDYKVEDPWHSNDHTCTRLDAPKYWMHLPRKPEALSRLT